MPIQTESFYANITLTDVQLASAYYPILIDLAKHKHCLTYGELVEQAKIMYPDKSVVQKAIAVSAGRRLDVVRIFTSERDLPDLTSLIINKEQGECGIGFTQHFDPKATREKVFARDWSEVSTDFDGFVQHAESAIKPRKKVKEPKALELMAEHYKNNKSTLPVYVREFRELIVELIMEGFSPEEAFAQAQPNGIQRSREAGENLPAPTSR
jgi:hypothetical protein